MQTEKEMEMETEMEIERPFTSLRGQYKLYGLICDGGFSVAFIAHGMLNMAPFCTKIINLQPIMCSSP